MNKKRKLSDLIRNETQRLEAADSPAQPTPAEKTPKYLTLIRKETRLREEQIDQLTTLARKLNRQKSGGERITENTLIRVAVDLLLSQSKALQGASEAELKAALGLEDE